MEFAIVGDNKAHHKEGGRNAPYMRAIRTCRINVKALALTKTRGKRWVGPSNHRWSGIQEDHPEETEKSNTSG